MSLLILVTGKRQMEVPALRPGLHWRFPQPRGGAQAVCLRRSVQSDGTFLSLLLGMRGPQGLGRQHGRPGAARPGAGSSPAHAASVRTVLPLLVLLVFLDLVGTLRAEPLHLFRRSSHDSHAGPVVPIVTVVTANHRAPVVRLVAARTDPDLIAPLITDHVGADRLGHYAPHWGFGTPSSREGRGWGWHQGGAHCGLGEEWRRQGSRAHSHRNRDRGRRRGFRSAQRRSGLSLRSRHHLADDDLVLASANSQSQPGNNWTWGWDDGLYFYLWKLVH